MVLLNDEKYKYYRNYIIYEPNRSLFYYPSKYHQNSECQGMSKDNGIWKYAGVLPTFANITAQLSMWFRSSGYENAFIYGSPTSCPGPDAYKGDKGLTSLARLLWYSK